MVRYIDEWEDYYFYPLVPQDSEDLEDLKILLSNGYREIPLTPAEEEMLATVYYQDLTTIQ